MAHNLQPPVSASAPSDTLPWMETSPPQTSHQRDSEGFSASYKPRHAPTPPIIEADPITPSTETAVRPPPAKKLDISSQPTCVHKAGQPPSALLALNEPTEITIPAGSKLVASAPVEGQDGVYMLGVENSAGVQTRYFIKTTSAMEITVKGRHADGSKLNTDLLTLTDSYAGTPTKGHWPPGTPGKSGKLFSDAEYVAKQQERAENYRALIAPQPALRQNIVPQPAASPHTGPHRTLCTPHVPTIAVPQPVCQSMPLTRRDMRKQHRHGLCH